MRMPLEFTTAVGLVRVLYEPPYSAGLQDNVRHYERYVALTQGTPTSVHGVELNGRHIVAVGAAGGCSTVHKHSAVVVADRLFVAVGDHIGCLSLVSPYAMLWATCVDDATCFGVYWDEKRQALLSHGELQIMRLSSDGEPVWSASGADVFSEGFRLLPDCIEAIDFNRHLYRFDYESGERIA